MIRLCEQFEKDFPGSEYDQQIRVTIAGARQALESQRSAGLSADLFEETTGDRDFRDDLIDLVGTWPEGYDIDEAGELIVDEVLPLL